MASKNAFCLAFFVAASSPKTNKYVYNITRNAVCTQTNEIALELPSLVNKLSVTSRNSWNANQAKEGIVLFNNTLNKLL